VVVAISQTEALWWRRLFPGVADKVRVVRHRPATNPADPVEGRRRLLNEFRLPPDRPIVVLVGSMDAKQNRTAAFWARDVLAPTIPDAVVVIAGQGSDSVFEGGPSPTGRAPDEVGQRPSQNVFALGEVDDIDVVIAAADVCLAPFVAAAGVKTKVLHYLWHGKPVFGTPLAFEDIEDAPGRFVGSLGEIPDQVASFLALPTDRVEAERRADHQRSWLDDYCGMDLIRRQWALVLADVRRSVAPSRRSWSAHDPSDGDQP